MPIEDLLHPLVGAYTRSPQWLKSSLGGVYAHLPVAWRYGARYGEFEAETRLVDPQAIAAAIMAAYHLGPSSALARWARTEASAAKMAERWAEFLASVASPQ